MFEQALKTLEELVAQISRLNDNLESKASAPEADTPAPKKAEKPASKKAEKTAKPKTSTKPEQEEEEESDDDLDDAVTAADVKAMARNAIETDKLTKDKVKEKISDVGANSLADCDAGQLAEIAAFIKESL